MTTHTPTATPLFDQKYSPIGGGIPNSNYGLDFKEFSETLDFLKRVNGDPNLQSQVIALFQSEWKPTIAVALHQFNEPLRCSEYNCFSGESGFHRRFSTAGQRRLDELIDEMRWIPVEKLDKAKFSQLGKRFRELELEYLDANLGATCKDLALNGCSRG
jgi:hypothetical protein